MSEDLGMKLFLAQQALIAAAVKWKSVHVRWKTKTIDQVESVVPSTRADMIAAEKRLVAAAEAFEKALGACQPTPGGE